MKYSKNHTVYYNKHKEEVPSVTTVLKVLNKPALVQWANRMGFAHKDINILLEESAIIGTFVHEVINSILRKSLYVYIKTDDRPPLKYIYGHLDAFFSWYKNNTIEPILLEKSLSCDEFGGTLDFYGKVNGKYTIIDFKTSKQIRFSMFLQLALYCILLELHGYKVEQVGIVLCNEKNRKVKYLSRDELNEYISISELLVKLFHKYYNLNNAHDWREPLV